MLASSQNSGASENDTPAEKISTSKSHMTISLIICAHNEEKYIGACLEAAVKERIPEVTEVIVIDNRSTDRTAAIASNFPRVRIVREDEKGLTRARARGLKEADGDILAYIDADTRMPGGWLSKALHVFTHHPHVVAVSGPQYYYELSRVPRFLNRVFWLAAYPVYLMAGFMLIGTAFAVRRESLEKVDGFDTAISFYGEDTNIARRLSKVGTVRFMLSLAMPTSARRFKSDGLVGVTLTYILNFFSEVFWHRPLTKNYKDIRE
jgi:glycosyltransferase involved in cell wall biosynthesis